MLYTGPLPSTVIKCLCLCKCIRTMHTYDVRVSIYVHAHMQHMAHMVLLGSPPPLAPETLHSCHLGPSDVNLDEQLLADLHLGMCM